MSYFYEFIKHQEDLPIRLFVNSVRHIPFHWHKEFEVLYVLQGSVSIHVDQQQYVLHQDDLIVINRMSVHQIERTSQDNVLLTLQFSPELIDDQTLISCNSLHQTADNHEHYDRIRFFLAQMTWESSKKAPGYYNYSSGILQLLTGHLLRHFTVIMKDSHHKDVKDYDYQRLNRVLQYIDRHFSQKITLQSIADQEHLSMHYFSHFFSDKIGIPFQKYLTSVRLDKALIQLIETEQSITQISLDCGFANVKLFNKYFKEKFESTPGQYREEFAAKRVATDPSRKPLTNDESSSGDYYEMDTIQAMESLYHYLEWQEIGSTAFHTNNVVYDQVDIYVHSNQAGSRYERHWNRLTSAGRAIEGLRADWQQQFIELQRSLSFSHIRFHGIFNDEMMIYDETETGEPIYNWSYVDKLYDFLLKTGIRPFVELSFMPTKLRRSNETIFWWKGNISPPADLRKWNALVHEFVRHCLNRYGLEEVKQWYFEVWNEPDLSGVCWAGSKEEYFAFYASTVRTIKSISSVLKVGGPALGYGSLWNDSWADDFMSYCLNEQVPMDFFSFHVYSEYPNQKDEAGMLTRIMPPSFYLDSVNRLQAKLAAHHLQELEIHMTEWNFSLYDRNFIHDTMFMASFVVYHAMQTLGTMTSMAFWSFTDVFEESQLPASIFYGGFGLMNRNGLKKPSYYAFEFLKKLGDHIIDQGDGYVVTKQADGSLQILMYHYTHVDPLFASGDWSGLTETSRYSVFEEKGNKAYHVKIDGLQGSYKMMSYRLDRTQGSVFDEWIAMGAPTNPTEEELDYLQQRSTPEMRISWLEELQSFEQTFIVPPHGLQLITLTKQY
ncbi:AraC family transcriptional regulator [Paenibacillus selenitireducens]|uniref:AraC family transcriptional regulator n=1 Tax=Paenibacillus selenitireducens TaxID=1324314 RepID=A0A1T2XMC3_9BACL|nr:helix-turn-helix domain-containing protein [Paenibacillus selenitireducens]OPA81017.1 AraC family transcriptional regulator [Paenibacillus selenitireducens]